MRELEKSFKGKGEVKGYNFTQMTLTDKAFLYEVERDGKFHYEVFKRVENNRFGCVSYPSSKSFGIWAWSCGTLKRALERFNELNSL